MLFHGYMFNMCLSNKRNPQTFIKSFISICYINLVESYCSWCVCQSACSSSKIVECELFTCHVDLLKSIERNALQIECSFFVIYLHSLHCVFCL